MPDSDRLPPVLPADSPPPRDVPLGPPDPATGSHETPEAEDAARAADAAETANAAEPSGEPVNAAGRANVAGQVGLAQHANLAEQPRLDGPHAEEHHDEVNREEMNRDERRSSFSGLSSTNRTPQGPQPMMRSMWILRIGALCAVVATALGRIVAPGLRGNASEDVVVFWDRAAAVSAYAMSCMLMAALVMGIYELSRRAKLGIGTRLVSVMSVGIIIATVLPAFSRRLPLLLAIIMAIATCGLCLIAALHAIRAPHTRAVATVLGLFGAAALARLFGWELAVAAGDHASAQLYAWARGVATAGVVFEGLGQLVAAAWLGTRTRLLGQMLSTAAVAAAFIMTWGAARGVQAGADLWEAVLHGSLGESASIPPSYGLSAIATFLVAASVSFALVAVVQRRQVVTITSALALALVGRGAYDAPLRALASAVAAVWILLALTDDRAMWRALMASRAPEPSDRAPGEGAGVAETAK